MELAAIGVIKQKEKQFFKAGINTVEDLAAILPRAYKDYTRFSTIIEEGEHCFVGTINKVWIYQGKVDILYALLTLDNGAELKIMWFNQLYRKETIALYVQKRVVVAGKVTYNERFGFSLSNPDLFEPWSSTYKGKVLPVYRSIQGMSKEYLEKHIRYAMSAECATAEIAPRDILTDLGYISRKEALWKLHYPETLADVELGRKRILFDDLLFFALNLELSNRKASKGSTFGIQKGLKTYHDVIKSLPYTLTGDQQQAIEDMLAIIRKGQRLNGLLVGDVGCGKSIVAFLLMTAMVDNSYQAAIMAPTQVLARQHYDDLCSLIEPFGLSVAFVDGGMKASDKKRTLEAIETGKVSLIVGTQAILGKNVKFKNLAMVIADEEHRFGVVQREELVKKAADGVHAITMSATPIPRTHAMAIYGDDVELFTIKQLPNGRQPIRTGISTKRENIYNRILHEKELGHQTYVVCPLIEESDKLENVLSVNQVAEQYKQALEPLGVTFEIMTGKNSKSEVEDIISRFKNGEFDVLISTTVVEVGVNNPNATIIVISNAERFGLATLHQLRGRVGRGKFQSYCVLEAGANIDPNENERLKVLTKTTDGFKIAEADLAIRGAGDFIGTVQHGENKYFSLMISYPDVYQTAKEAAKKLIDRGDESDIVKKAMSYSTENDSE